MAQNYFSEKTHDILQGIVFMITGILLLFYSLNIATTVINILIIALSVGLIIYGLSLSGIAHNLKNVIKLISPGK